MDCIGGKLITNFVSICASTLTKIIMAQVADVTNIAENYSWVPQELILVTTEAELLAVLERCKANRTSVRVRASGWSCNQFIDPNSYPYDARNDYTDDLGSSSDQKLPDDSDSTGDGINIVLGGEFSEVGDFEVIGGKHTLYSGAAVMRQAVYTKLDTVGKELLASGECFLSSESQQVGGLIVNAVHDTMQRAFTPETVVKVRAAVFKDGEAVIEEFDQSNGDFFYAFFGGVGMTGIIVGAWLVAQPKTYYHKLVYENGLEFREKYFPGTVDTNQPTNSEPGNAVLLPSDNYAMSFADAMHDLVFKHCEGPDPSSCSFRTQDIAACFVHFHKKKRDDGSEEEKGEKRDGKVREVYGPATTVNTQLSRFYTRTNSKPEGASVVKQDKYNDYAEALAHEFCSSDAMGVNVLAANALAVEISVKDLKYKYANYQNFRQLGFPHWAFYESAVAHTTGPHYIHLWAKAVEFYIHPDRRSTEAFCVILESAIRRHLLPIADSKINLTQNAIFADCRYAYQTKTAFMTGFYNHDALVIDIGCVKYNNFTNEVYTAMVSEVLIECQKQNIEVRIHTGKFFVYDPKLIRPHYQGDCSTRLRSVIEKHDPFHVFAPQKMRDLFLTPV